MTHGKSHQIIWAILDESNCERKKGNATIKIYLLLYFVKMTNLSVSQVEDCIHLQYI